MLINRKNILNFLDFVKWFGLRKVYYRFQAQKLKQNLINKDFARLAIDYYDGNQGQNTDLKTNNLGFGLLHYALVRNLKPKNVLVVGSLKGYVPALIAAACRDNHFGQVDFVDAAFDEENNGKNWQGIGFWKKTNPQAHFAKIGVDKYLTLHIMTTQEFSKKHPHKKYQYIYIDGDHSYEGVKLDYKLFYPKLEKNGLMSFHDIVATGQLTGGDYGVQKFWQEIKSQTKITFPFPKNSGLGILQKR